MFAYIIKKYNYYILNNLYNIYIIYNIICRTYNLNG